MIKITLIEKIIRLYSKNCHSLFEVKLKALVKAIGVRMVCGCGGEEIICVVLGFLHAVDF